MISYRKINSKNINHISEIWISSLPKNIYSLLGEKMISIYLDFFFSRESNIAFGAFSKKKLVGFVLFGTDRYINNIILKKKTKSLISQSVRCIFSNPMNLLFFFDVLIYIIFFNKKKEQKNAAELLIICVRIKHKSNGIGSKLINFSIKNLENKFNQIYVKTLTKSIQNINFYQKNRFSTIFTEFGRATMSRDLRGN